VNFDKKNILITGGTGSFGNKCVEELLKRFNCNKLIIFSRDEQKQYEMAQKFPESKYPNIRYFIGDVRDKDRIERACSGVDILVHAAAMKHVTASEYNPSECIETNIIGAENVINAALRNKVQRVIALSTDKAANPINLYGATKLCSDKLFVAANNLSGKQETRFSVVRYGNVLASRGSVIPYFKKLLDEGAKELPVTDINMTRFIITLQQGVDFVLSCLPIMLGGEIFVPKLPSIKIIDIVTAMLDEKKFKIIGIRPGEKLHEVMIPEEESLNCIDMGNYYLIQPMHSWWNTKKLKQIIGRTGAPVSESFEYCSNKNSDWLSINEIKKLVK
tara:strand:- start:7343 stop:8338 length:996 start_codon:yes stop_codon:yes gene_type:complete